MHRYKQNKRDDQSAANHRQTTGKPTLYIPFRPTPSGDGLFCDPTPAPVMPDHKKKRGAECLDTNYEWGKSEKEDDSDDDEYADEDESDEEVVPPKTQSTKTTQSRRRRRV